MPLGSRTPARKTGAVARNVVNRMLVAFGVGAYVAAVYVLVVLGGGALLRATPPSLPLAVVATGVVAVTLEPVRRALRRVFVVSAFDRLAAFGAAMAGAVATEQVGPRMARLLADGTGARRVEVWLRADGGEELLAGWPDGDPVDRSAPTVEVHDVRHAGELLGRVVRDGAPLRPVERELRDDLLGQAGLALRQVALAARLRRGIELSAARAEQLRESRQRIVSTADAARVRLERDIHDGAQQRLLALMIELRLAREAVGADPNVDLAARLDRAMVNLRSATDELRELARGVRPAILADAGLGPAVRTLAERSSCPVELSIDLARRLDAAVESAAYFVVAESLANVVRHASATVARVDISLEPDPERVVVAVTDDGVGGASVDRGSGIRGLKDRVEALGGQLALESPAGNGTRIRVELPCAL